jgi:gliding motility-associated lipoprotein GldD
MQQIVRDIWIIAGLCVCSACSDYTPKPRGYFRIEPPTPSYASLASEQLPYSFHVSSLARVELPAAGSPEGWLTVSYPSLGAKLYCSYLPVSRLSLGQVIHESNELVTRQAKYPQYVELQVFTNPEEGVYASLFESVGGGAVPIQFTLTDSARHFFRGTLLYDRPLNADSLAPVTRYLREDVVELIQSFHWKK